MGKLNEEIYVVNCFIMDKTFACVERFHFYLLDIVKIKKIMKFVVFLIERETSQDHKHYLVFIERFKLMFNLVGSSTNMSFKFYFLFTLLR